MQWELSDWLALCRDSYSSCADDIAKAVLFHNVHSKDSTSLKRSHQRNLWPILRDVLQTLTMHASY